MKKRLFYALMIALMLTGVFAITGSADKGDPICHNAGDNQFVLIPPDSDSYGGHFGEDGLKHGDVFAEDGECPQPEPEIENLNLTFMQPCKPPEGTPESAEWRIRNPNDFSVDVKVVRAGGGTVYEGSVGPGDTFFNTPWGSQTLILKWDGGQKTKAGGDSYNGQDCYEVCSETKVRGPVVEYGPWSSWSWDGELGFYIRTRTVTSTYYIVDAYDGGHICNTRVVENEEIQRRAPDEVVTNVSLSCGPEAGDGKVYQLYYHVDISPSGGATVSFNGDEFTNSKVGYVGFGSHGWSAEAADGYTIVGKDGGSVKLQEDDCNGGGEPETPRSSDAGGPADVLPLALGGISILGLAGAGVLSLRRRR